MQKRLLLFSSCLLLSGVCFAQAKQKLFRLEDKVIFIKPLKFYISEVVDGRPDTTNIGYVDIGVFNRKVPANIEGGLESGLRKLIANNLWRDTSLIPVRVIVKRLEVSESRNLRAEYGRVEARFNFQAILNKKNLDLFDYAAGGENLSHMDVTNGHPKLIDRAFADALSSFDDWLNRNINSLPPYKGVRANAELSEAASASADSLVYTRGHKLTWQNFQGTPDVSSPFYAATMAGFIYHLEPSIHEGYLDLDIKVKCYFLPSFSWVKKNLSNAPLLAHEQLHFDIAYIYSRILVQKISTYLFTIDNFQEEIKTLVNQALSDLKKTQDEYDDQTNHGRIPDQQTKWKSKIESQLND